MKKISVFHPVTGKESKVSPLNAHDLQTHLGYTRNSAAPVILVAPVVLADLDPVEPLDNDGIVKFPSLAENVLDPQVDASGNVDDEPIAGSAPGTLEAMKKDELVAFMKTRGMTPDGRQSHAKLLAEAKTTIERQGDK